MPLDGSVVSVFLRPGLVVGEVNTEPGFLKAAGMIRSRNKRANWNHHPLKACRCNNPNEQKGLRVARGVDSQSPVLIDINQVSIDAE